MDKCKWKTGQQQPRGSDEKCWSLLSAILPMGIGRLSALFGFPTRLKEFG